MSEPNWSHCSKVLSLLNADECMALYKLRSGTLPDDATLDTFRRHELVWYLNGVYGLTDDGRMVATFCERDSSREISS